MHEAKKDETLIDYYVCSNCFSRVMDCNCDHFPSGTLIYIDKGIQEHIKILRSKKYMTTSSCESHSPNGGIQITFSRYDGIEGLELPEGFVGQPFGTSVEFHYPKNMSTKDFKSEKKKRLAILLEWCKNLPERKEL